MDKENNKEINNYDIRDARKYQEIRKRFIYKIANKDITFKQFCLFAQSEEYKTLRGIKISTIMNSFSTWTTFSIQHAFIAYNIPINITVRQVMKNKNYFNIISALMDSSSSSWQKRIKAPEGFPWNGNIIKALNELNDIELPRELETAVRYYPDKDNENNKDPYEEFEKESLVNDNKENNNTDDLDILLSSEEENEDDGLDSFLSDDIEEYNKDEKTKNNIQDKLNDIMNSENDEDNLDQLLDDDDEDYINNLF